MQATEMSFLCRVTELSLKLVIAEICWTGTPTQNGAHTQHVNLYPGEISGHADSVSIWEYAERPLKWHHLVFAALRASPRFAATPSASKGTSWVSLGIWQGDLQCTYLLGSAWRAQRGGHFGLDLTFAGVIRYPFLTVSALQCLTVRETVQGC